MKIYFILFFLIFIISFCSSASLYISPPQLEFEGKVGEEICSEFYLETDNNYTVLGEDRWSELGFAERKLPKHKFKSEDLELEIKYPKEIFLQERTLINICLKGENPGNYHGVLLYQIKDKPVKVGIWMNVSLNEFSVKSMDIFEEGFNEKISYRLVILPILLIILLIFLFLKSKKKNNEFKE